MTYLFRAILYPFLFIIVSCSTSRMHEQGSTGDFLFDSKQLPEERLLLHTVRFPGENLSLIAKWYTGAEENWEKLLAYNGTLVPERLKEGDIVRIPSGEAIRSVPFEKSYVDEFFKSQRSAGSSSVPLKEIHEQDPERGRGNKAVLTDADRELLAEEFIEEALN